MPAFSQRSLERLATCDERLQRVLAEAIKSVDFSIICGHRGQDEQNEAYSLGRSTLRWPNSKHNTLPSMAVDIAPYPVDWQDTARFARLFGYVERIADEMGISLRWGGDFDDDGRTANERFVDMPHIEVVD